MFKLKLFLLSAVLLFSSLGFSVDVRSTTTITDPVGNVTTKVYFGAYPFSVTETRRGSVLSTTEYCYNGASQPCVPNTVTLPVTQKDVYTTLQGVASSKASSTYNTYGLPLDEKAFDYGPSLKVERITTYCSLGNVNVRNRACDILTKDGGGATAAHTTATYSSSGNMLSHSFLVAGSTFLTESFTYSSKGLPLTSTGVNGAQSTYTNGACGGLEATAITFQSTGTESFTWDCLGAVPLSVTDVNSSTYTIAYKDPFYRPTSGVDSLGVTTTYTYTPNTTKISSTGASDKLVTYSPAGRVVVQQVKGAGLQDTASQSFDPMGRKITSSLPCASSASVPCSSVQITAQYDTGSVPTTILTDALGGTVITEYSKGNQTITVGNKTKQLEYDGLGRLTSVCEVSSGAGSGDCGQRVGQVGFVTTYAYDALGFVTSVTQGAQTRSFTRDNLGRVLTSTQPESGTTTYTYDTTGDCGGITSNGSLVESVDANGNTSCFHYDLAGRLTKVNYSGPNTTPEKHFVYDSATVNGVGMANAKGRLAEAYTCTTCPGTKLTDVGFSYNSVGQIVDEYESTTNSGGYYHLAMTTYSNKVLRTLTMTPSVLPVIKYGLDAEGRTSTVEADSTPLVTNTVRGPGNQITSISYGNSDSDVFSYDNSLKMTQYAFGVNGNSILGTTSYNTDGTMAARITTDPYTAANNASCSYSYDAWARISKANCGAVNQSFGYDRYGNSTKTGSFSFTPTYSATTNRMTAIGVVTPTYDANGNLLTDGTNTYTWDADGSMLSGPGIDSVTYNAFDQIAETTTGSTHQQTIYLPSGDKLALMNGQALVLARIPLPGGAQAVYNSSGLIYYAHVDDVGSVRVTSTPARTLFSDLSYAPFGEVSNQGTAPASALNFAGHNQDAFTGLFNSPTRQYNPLQSRWVSSDKSGDSRPGDPQTNNLYTYATNRPFDRVDVSGAGDDDPTYGPGLGGQVQDPSSYDPYGFLNSDAEKPLVYNAGEPAGGAGGSYTYTDNLMQTLSGVDPLGLVAELDITQGLYLIGAYEGTENITLRIARGLETATGSGPNSLKAVEEITDRVLSKYGSLIRPTSPGPRLALGLTNPGMSRSEVRTAVNAVGYKNFRSGLNSWADTIGAKSWSSFDTKGDTLISGIHSLMDQIREEGGTIHFNLDGLEDIPAAVAGTSRQGHLVEVIGETDWLGKPKMIRVPYNNGVTVEELRYLKNNWEAFRPMTYFYNGGTTPTILTPGLKPYVPW